MKRVLSAVLVIVLSSCFSITSYANNFVNFMTSTYSKALELADNSDFNGSCGRCVGMQLWALGINNKYIGHNGNNMYDTYANVNQTNGGYYANKFPVSTYSMSDFLNYVNGINTTGEYTYITLGFQKGSSDSDGQAYGHTLLIYAVYNGIVYYTESWGTSVRTQSISDFCYSYRCRVASNGKTAYQDEGSVWFSKIQNPTPPTNVQVSTQGTTVTVSWNASENATSYDVYLVQEPWGWEDVKYSQTSYVLSSTFTNVVPGHYAAFVITRPNSNTVQSEWKDFTVNSPIPQAPTVTANDCSVGSQTIITWNYVENATKYYLYIRNRYTEEEFYTGFVGNTNSFSITLPAGDYYTYVSAFNDAGDYSPTYAEFKVKPLPGKPIVSCAMSEYGEIKFCWQEVSLADMYDLRIFHVDESLYSVDYGIKSTEYISNLPQGEYFAQVAAVNLANENWTNSDRLYFTIENYIPKKPIVNVENCCLGETTVIWWDSVLNAQSYYIYIRDKATEQEYYTGNIGGDTQFSITLPRLMTS